MLGLAAVALVVAGAVVSGIEADGSETLTTRGSVLLQNGFSNVQRLGAGGEALSDPMTGFGETLAGYEAPVNGYCKMNDGGSPYGLGVVEKDSVQACADHCDNITAPMECRGFNVAPKHHMECHLFAEVPATVWNSTDNAWQCYGKERYSYSRSDVAVEEGAELCFDSDDGALDTRESPCEAYSRKPDECGLFDDVDFTAREMCCACLEKEHSEDGLKECKDWCYNKKHKNKGWHDTIEGQYTPKCDWLECARCQECAA